MKKIIILGPPGSGKGTQAKKLAAKFGFAYLSTGDLMRKEAKKDTPQGRYFAQVQAAGIIIDNDQIQNMIETALNELKQSNIPGMVLDGVPRTLKQIKLLDKVFPTQDFQVINIKLSPQSTIKRITSRRVCDKCGKIFIGDFNFCDKCGGKIIHRSDDKEEVVLKRLEEYNKETEPVVEYFRKKGQLTDIDGGPTIPEVEKEILEKIKEKIG